MRKSRTPDTATAHKESEVEEVTASAVMLTHMTSEGSARRRVSTEEFVAKLQRDEVERRREELASKLLLPSAEFRARLRISPQALSRAVKTKRMYSLSGPDGEDVYPAFFTEQSPGRTVLEQVCKALGDLPGGCKHFFFVSTRISLGKMSPLEALARGNIGKVLAAAEAFRET